MDATKQDILRQLQQDILPLQGFKPPSSNTVDVGLGRLNDAFPNGVFPAGAVHEFISTAAEELAASGGFIAGLLGSLMQQGGACIWIGSGRTLFPPALKVFGVEPDRMIFIDIKKEKDALWAMEEALKCEGLAAVIGEIKDINFTASRRLQLAVEQSRVTGFLLRHQVRSLNTIACVARWKITALASEPEEGIPGVGHPRWNVELLKIRNGKPGQWRLEWSDGRFHVVDNDNIISMPVITMRKTGSYG